MSTKALREILADLVSFRTVTGDYEQAAALLSHVRGRVNGHMHEQDFVSRDFPSLILKTRNTRRPKLTLSAHIDVVPAEDGQFRLVKDGDKLYGRGTFDMKFALACYLRLLDELRPNLADYDFALMLTSDEEAAGNDGTRALLDNGYQTDVCFLPDGGDNWAIEEKIKGMWVVELTCDGVAAHGSRPWEGDNPSQKIIDALHAIQQANTDDPDGTTVVVTRLDAPTAPTKIADQATAVVDMRFTTMAAYEELRTHLYASAEAHGCTVGVLALNYPIDHDLGHPLVRPFMAGAAQVIGAELRPSMSYGSSDGRFFVDHNIPVITIRPAGGGQHGADEWISESGMERFYQALRRYVEVVAFDPAHVPVLMAVAK